MNHKTVKFGRAMILSVLFFVSIFSLALAEDGASSTWNTVHVWSGALMLAGAGVHLMNNMRWVKAVFSRPARQLQRRVRRLRHTNLILFISGGLCTLAGIIWLLPGLSPASLQSWAGLHRLSGMLMILALGIHLLLHWGWLVATVRQLSGARRVEAGDGVAVGGK